MEVNGVRVSGDQVCEGTERRMGMKVVVGVDDSKGSFYALRWALDNLFIPMASPESGGMLFLVHVQPNLFDYGYPVEPTGIGSYYYLAFPSFSSFSNMRVTN